METWDNELIAVIVDELRTMAHAGANVPSMLRRIQQIVGPQGYIVFISLKSFRIAFDSGIASIKPITGWCGFGGELTDDDVEHYVSGVIERYRNSCRNREPDQSH